MEQSNDDYWLDADTLSAADDNYLSNHLYDKPIAHAIDITNKTDAVFNKPKASTRPPQPMNNFRSTEMNVSQTNTVPVGTAKQTSDSRKLQCFHCNGDHVVENCPIRNAHKRGEFKSQTFTQSAEAKVSRCATSTPPHAIADSKNSQVAPGGSSENVVAANVNFCNALSYTPVSVSRQVTSGPLIPRTKKQVVRNLDSEVTPVTLHVKQTSQVERDYNVDCTFDPLLCAQIHGESITDVDVSVNELAKLKYVNVRLHGDVSEIPALVDSGSEICVVKANLFSDVNYTSVGKIRLRGIIGSTVDADLART
jgi:hypothetical protein